MLAWLAGHRFLSQRQVVEIVFGGSAQTAGSKVVMTQRLLRDLRQRGLVGATARQVGGLGGGSARMAYFLTAHGCRVAGTLVPGLPGQRRERVRGTFLLAHAAMGVDVALAFRRSARTHEGHELVAWEADWQVALKLGPSKVVPDARLVYCSKRLELTAFVEVDLGTEGTRFFQRKVRRYIDLRHDEQAWLGELTYWPYVLTVTRSHARAALLCQATEAVLESEYGDRAGDGAFRFAALSEMAGPEGPLGPIWLVPGKTGRQPLLDDDSAAECVADEAHARVASDVGQPLAPGKEQEPVANLNNRDPELRGDA